MKKEREKPKQNKKKKNKAQKIASDVADILDQLVCRTHTPV